MNAIAKSPVGRPTASHPAPPPRWTGSTHLPLPKPARPALEVEFHRLALELLQETDRVLQYARAVELGKLVHRRTETH